MATIEQYKSALIQADRSGDTQASKLFSRKIKELQQQEPSLLDRAAGIPESAMTFASGLVTEPAAGLAGLAGLIDSPETGARNVDFVRSLTYEPRSQTGKDINTAASELLQPLGEGLQYAGETLGDAAYDVTGSPAVGAAASAVPTAILEGLGIKGASKVGRAGAVARQADNVTDSVESAARSGLMNELNIPTTQSRVTQAPSDFLTERTLLRNTELPEADILRQRIADESAGFQMAARELADNLGIAEESGALIKDALYSRMSKEKSKVTDAYKELAKLSGGDGIPLAGRSIENAMVDKDFAGMVNRLDQADKVKINDIMVEFGLDTKPASIENWSVKRQTNAGMLPEKTTITPLNILNFNEMNKSLNNILRPDSDPALKGVIGKLKDAVKKEVDALEESLKEMTPEQRGKLGDKALDSANAAKRAIEQYKGFSKEFSSGEIVDKLTSKRKGSFDEEMILSSEVARKLFSNTREGAIENVNATVNSLIKSGEKGKKALGALQSHVVTDLMNDALRATSGKLEGGVRKWSGTNFINKLNKIGDEKLQAVFKNNPAALKQIYKIRDAGELTIPFEQIARHSGTADDLINHLQSNPAMSRVFSAMGGVKGWMAAQTIEGAAGAAKKRGLRKKLRKALDSSPVLKQNFTQFKNQYPELAAALLIGNITTTGKDND